MHKAQSSIVENLLQVAEERRRRASQPELQGAVDAVKRYQQQRFTRTYADLLATERYGPAARFFLGELYGPADFTRRDSQFMRVVPALVRLFPSEIVHTVDTMTRLHAVSERLDSRMGTHLGAAPIGPRSYIGAWQATGQAEQREAQIALTLEVGAALDRYTRKPVLRHTLRMMRGAARAAGLGELQGFLEAGFDAFKAMQGAQEFLACIGRRERQLAEALFDADLAGDRQTLADEGGAVAAALSNLP